MISTPQAVIQQAGTFLVALVLLTGTFYLAVTGHPVPMWLVGFDGLAIGSVYGNAQSFVQARTALPTHLALSEAHSLLRSLLPGGTQTVSPTVSGTTEPTGASRA